MGTKGKLNCIMLIDDDEAISALQRRVIYREELGVHVVTLFTGRDALSYLKDEEEPQPGIIFLDLNMPGMSGWEFLEHYKRLAQERKRRIALYILTTRVNQEDEKHAKEYPDLNGFLRKPLTSEKLYRVIKEHFPE